MPPTSEVSKYGAGLSSDDGSDEEDGVAAAGSSVATSSAVVVGQQMVVHPLARLQKLDDLVGRLGDGRSDGGPEGFLGDRLSSDNCACSWDSERRARLSATSESPSRR